MVRLRALIRRMCLIPACLLGGYIGPLEAPGSWHAYEVYSPSIERVSVSDAAHGMLLYNHGTALAWYRDRWFYLWNANPLPGETQPNQLIYQATSRDGRNWSAPSPAFASGRNSVNPVSPEGGTQWQPAIGVVGDELWVLWNQWGAEDARGSFFSRRSDPDDRWQTLRLTWGENVSGPQEVEGWRIYPSQNLYRLRNGRILVSVIMIDQSGPAHDAPDDADDWWALEKRNSVLYTDDHGQTWRASPGWTLPGASWTGWEPTLWEQGDGSVRMFARNNVHPRFVDGPGLPPHQTLTMSVSHDHGETWSAGEMVPIDSTVSLMHVIPQDGRGVWEIPSPGDDLAGRRYFMVHNDVSAPGWGLARRNLTLYFQRGDGFEFTPGIGLTEHERIVSYPRLWSRDNSLYMSYTRGPAHSSSARFARIHPLPDPDTFYLLPRNNMPPPARPEMKDSTLRFEGHQHVQALNGLQIGNRGMSLGALVNVLEGDVLIDTRGAGGGFLLMLVGGEGGLLYPRLLFGGHGGAGPRSSLGLGRGKWSYVGFTLDAELGEVAFHVNGERETLPVGIAGPLPPLGGVPPYIGDRRPGSELQGMVGSLRMMSIYDSPALDASGHAWLLDRYGGELGVPSTSKGAAPGSQPAFLLDPADRAGFNGQFSLPSNEKALGVFRATEGEVELLTFAGAASAGVELGENDRAGGDAVELELLFRLEKNEAVTLLTVGDAVEPARIRARPAAGGPAMQILLSTFREERILGEVPLDRWVSLEVHTRATATRARMADGRWEEAGHHPRGTWIHLGEGYPGERPCPMGRFSVDTRSVRSRSSPGVRP